MSISLIEKLLPPEIVYIIFNHLDKVSIFIFLSTNQQNSTHKQYIFDHYQFDDDKITNNDIKKFIRKIKVTNLNNLDQYISLTSLHIINNEFNQSLGILPTTLTDLRILSSIFDQPLDLSLCSLNSLCVGGMKFNKQLNLLPGTLESLILFTEKYEHSFDSLPLSLKEFNIMCFSMSRKAYETLPKCIKNFECYTIL